MRQSFAVIGDSQFLPGYCVLLVDDPSVDRLTDLPKRKRRRPKDSLSDLTWPLPVGQHAPARLRRLVDLVDLEDGLRALAVPTELGVGQGPEHEDGPVAREVQRHHPQPFGGDERQPADPTPRSTRRS